MNRTHVLASLISALLVLADPARAGDSLAAWTWEAPSPQVSLASGGYRPSSMFVDFGPRGDGLADCVCADDKTGQVSIWRQTPTGFGPREPETYRLPSEAWLYDFGDVDGNPGAEIVYLSRDGFARFVVCDPKAGQPGALFQFAQEPLDWAPELSRGGFLADLNGDGRVDIVTPGQTSFDWHVQSAPGRFTPGPSLKAAPKTSVAFRVRERTDRLFGPLQAESVSGGAAGSAFAPGSVFLIRPRPPISVDFERSLTCRSFRLRELNRDDRLDIEGPPPILQTAEGGFDPSAIGAKKPPASGSGEKAFPPKGFPAEAYVRDDLDVNGDGVPDQVAMGLSDWRTSFHDARARMAVQVLSSDEKTAVFSQDQSYDGIPWMNDFLIDVDGDGALDLVLLTVDFDLASVNSQVKAFFGKGLEGEIHVHFWSAGKGYSSRPDARRRIRFVGDLKGMLQPYPKILFSADCTGDGRPDLLIREDPRALTLIPFDPARRQYASQPAGTISLPADPQLPVVVYDLNGDRKADLILWLRQEQNPDEPRLFVAVLR